MQPKLGKKKKKQVECNTVLLERLIHRWFTVSVSGVQHSPCFCRLYSIVDHHKTRATIPCAAQHNPSLFTVVFSGNVFIFTWRAVEGAISLGIVV